MAKPGSFALSGGPVAEKASAPELTDSDDLRGVDHVVELDRVSFSYPNGLEAVSDVSLTLRRGQSVAFVGPSGCGKSTLLRILSGLDQPSAGQLRTQYRARKGQQTVSMMFQEDTLLPWLTVRSNVALFHRLNHSGVPRSEIRARVDDLLESVGLTAFGDTYPKQLSGGMKRRTAFLASIAAWPELLLLDEPFSSLDEPTRVQVHEQVRTAIERSALTTVLVTHDLAEAITLADEIVVLSARPARIVARHRVNVTRGGDILGLRNQPDFLSLYGEIWRKLSEQIRLAATSAPPLSPKVAR